MTALTDILFPTIRLFMGQLLTLCLSHWVYSIPFALFALYEVYELFRKIH